MSFTISDRLRELRYTILTSDPSDYTFSDLNKFGQELNEFRTVLARLANVHNGTGKITGWGHLDGTVPASWIAARARSIEGAGPDESEDADIVIPDDDEEPPRRRASSRSKAT